jgi:hypothetical protein
MNQAGHVIIYGASGYTGKLIAESLHRRGIPFTAAGRNEERLQQALEIVAERVGAARIDAEIAVVPHEQRALANLFEGARVVINVTGPFAQIGEPVVAAALQAGCHYLDTTGEQDFMLAMQAAYGQSFAERGLLLSPACSYMWTMGALAAEVCLESPAIDTLEICYAADRGVPSVASTRSFMRMLVSPHYFLQDNQMVEWPLGQLWNVHIPQTLSVYRGSSWGGAAEPAWYRDDPRVRNCKVLQCADNNAMEMVIGAVKQIIAQSEGQPPEVREAISNGVADTITLAEPEKEDPLVHRAVVSCRGRGTRSYSACTLVMHSPYVTTGELIAHASERLLNGEPDRTGFASAAQAFGHRELLDMLERGGFLTVTE